MKKKTIFLIVCAFLISFLLSCERISQQTDLGSVTTELEISADYGSLIAVTIDGQYPGWGQLWFSDAQGTITMMRVNWEGKTMLKDPLVISRGRTMTGKEGAQ